MRVLVAEDDEVLAKAVAVGLRREGMAVDIALGGDDAIAHLAVNRYDVVVLDRDLPGTHGDDVCRALVADRATRRVLMLTAATSVKDRVEGLGLGADDYLPKPFEFSELALRGQRLARTSNPYHQRAGPGAGCPRRPLHIGGVEVHRPRRCGLGNIRRRCPRPLTSRSVNTGTTTSGCRPGVTANR